MCLPAVIVYCCDMCTLRWMDLHAYEMYMCCFENTCVGAFVHICTYAPFSECTASSLKSLLHRAGVLFICYRRGWFFWETIYLARRTLMIGLYVALFNKEEGRSFALSFACIVISAGHIAILPFEDQLENLAETISLNSLSVISVLQASQFSDTFEGDTNVLVAIFIIVPVAFVLYIMVKGFLRPILRPLWRWIRRVCCKVDPEGSSLLLDFSLQLPSPVVPPRISHAVKALCECRAGHFRSPTLQKFDGSLCVCVCVCVCVCFCLSLSYSFAGRGGS